jgi:hypothetical protein
MSEKIDQYEANRRSLATAALAVKQAKIDAEKSFTDGYKLGVRDGGREMRDWLAELEREILSYQSFEGCETFIRRFYAKVMAAKESLSRHD